MGKETLGSLQQNGLCKLQGIIDSLTGKERNDLLVLLGENKLERKERVLSMMIDNLRQNHIERHSEELKHGGEIYKGQRVCLDLGCDKFECFIPYHSFGVDRSECKISKLIKDRGFSFDDIVDLFNMVGEYLKNFLSNIDDSLVIKQLLVTNSLDGSVEWVEGNDVGRCVVDVLGLDGICYFLNAYKLSIHDGLPKYGCLFNSGTIKYSGMLWGGSLLLKL